LSPDPAGPLKNARLLAPFTMVWIDQAYDLARPALSPSRALGQSEALPISYAIARTT
jgi:hypothetical protein